LVAFAQLSKHFLKDIHLNPMPFAAAVTMEKDLAEDLRRAGFTVTGGH
jgi:hypothetical protein